jgi:hypothetical protein
MISTNRMLDAEDVAVYVLTIVARDRGVPPQSSTDHCE